MAPQVLVASKTATTAIVTGSGRGIGKATALLLAKNGVNVVICSRTENEIDNAVNEVSNFHDGVFGLVCDVSEASQVEDLVKKTIARFGHIDVLVNNAGIFYNKKLVDTSEKEWDDTINSNLKSVFLCSKAVLPNLSNSGTIINVSSGAGKRGFDNLSAYCASKFGIMGLTESLSWEVTGRIRIMTICPGEVDTRMQKSDPLYYFENKSKMLKPEVVAEKIVEMVFDSNNYGNGQSVDI